MLGGHTSQSTATQTNCLSTSFLRRHTGRNGWFLKERQYEDAQEKADSDITFRHKRPSYQRTKGAHHRTLWFNTMDVL